MHDNLYSAFFTSNGKPRASILERQSEVGADLATNIHATGKQDDLERKRVLNTPSFIVCRCEEVSLEQLQETAERYSCSSRELKLRTRAGMGYCGGRTCRLLVEKIVQEIVRETPSPHLAPLKYQPPVRPVSFQHLGGER